MHAAGMWTVFAGTAHRPAGGSVRRRTKFNPRVVLETAEREKVGMMTMVGDAYAAPLVEELSAAVYELSSLYAIGTGGAATNPEAPARTAGDCCRSSPSSTATAHRRPATWGSGTASAGRKGDLRSARGRAGALRGLRPDSCEPGEPEVGWVVRAGRIPLGYFDDADATRKTFPVVDGAARGGVGRPRLAGSRRHAAAVRPRLAGGQHRGREGLRRRGRGGAAGVPGCRRRAGGRPAERAVGRGDRRARGTAARRRPSTPSRCTPRARRHLARFKAPKEFIFVDKVRRLGNGKADYRWAKSQAMQQASLT